jgi:hypothetical protein
MVDDHKVSFIMCVNDKQAAEEASYYISKLQIPEGFTTEIIAIADAASISEGYNKAMNVSQAKYKVYLHQDVFILNENFIADVLNIFNGPDSNIGMIGMVGTPEMPEGGIMWQADRVGGMYDHKPDKTKMTIFDKGKDGGCFPVDAIDGFMMITQVDIPWREDVIKGWDFYDASQSFEFRRRGYKVVVPHQNPPWCLHDDGYLHLGYYFMARQSFLNEYRDMINTGIKETE